MAKNLVIVESPAKAKTIEKILGKDFDVKSSFGHIRDLEKKNMGIDIEGGFQPLYKEADDKAKVIRELKKEAKKADEVWLATDEDREGEAISWHLAEVLGLDPQTTKRIVFHEITEPAIKEAVEHPRQINLDLVDAQQARRILDRIVGFEISPILWRKMSLSHNLSAGRVQSVAVRLIVDREREIENYDPKSSFKTEAVFLKDGEKREIGAKLNTDFGTEAEAQKFMEESIGAEYAVDKIHVRPGKKTPPAPFTTSTLQQEASRKLGYSVSRTMLLAQRLYEAGYISYMRTDSVTLSQTIRTAIEQTVKSQYGEQYYAPRFHKNKNKNAQEAHEAIRPTDPARIKVKNSDEQKLYDLIRNRTLASQMADVKLEKTTVHIGISNSELEYKAEGEVIVFDGFLKLYVEGKDADQEAQKNILPAMSEGEELRLKEAHSTQKFSRPPARYTEASLVKKMEELGIGRPSTYAPTISTIQKREYVLKGDKKGTPRDYTRIEISDGNLKNETLQEMAGADRNKLMPTDIGMLVNDFLQKHFDEILDYGFTARVEKDFDDIARGEMAYQQMISEFYKDFHPRVEDVMENADRFNGERYLGDDPETGKPIYAKVGRYGPMVQMGETDSEEKPRFASISQGLSLNTITKDEALRLFELPRSLGEYENKEIKANIGRFGPYILHDGVFVSLKDYDVYDVNREQAIEVIENKRESDRKKLITDFPEHDMKVTQGRWGPFIKKGKKSYKLTKEQKENADKISLEEALAIVEEQDKNAPTKKAAKKKAATKKKASKKKSTKKKATKKKAVKKTSTKKAASKKKQAEKK